MNDLPHSSCDDKNCRAERRSYLCSRVHEAGVAQIGKTTQSGFLTLPALFRVLIVVKRWVWRNAIAGVLHTAVEQKKRRQSNMQHGHFNRTKQTVSESSVRKKIKSLHNNHKKRSTTSFVLSYRGQEREKEREREHMALQQTSGCSSRLAPIDRFGWCRHSALSPASPASGTTSNTGASPLGRHAPVNPPRERERE